MPYPIIQVPADAPIGDEQLGSKNKFWFRRNDERWLFKEARAGTGEDWAEKLVSVVAARVGIHAATVELAEFAGNTRGCASRSFIRPESEALIHGNEILAGQILGYDQGKKLRQSDHTLGNIVKAFVMPLGERHPDGVRHILTELAGFMVLDALVGNTDRHHENWGVVARYVPSADPKQPQYRVTVAPSFDHASSLGRELRDERRLELLSTPGDMETYMRKGHGGIYLNASDRKGANPLHLVEEAAKTHPDYFRPALEAVAAVPARELIAIAQQLPRPHVSDVAVNFAATFLTTAQSALKRIPL